MMTTLEMSNEFDILAQSYLREGGFTISDSSLFAFNEYEKSLYLTREQEKLVVALYSGMATYGGFELTEQIRRDLETLLMEDSLTPEELSSAKHVSPNSQFFKLPKGLWFIVYEAGSYADSDLNCDSEDGFGVEVVPVTYDDLHRMKGNPFRGPSKRRALRLDKGELSERTYVEILPKYELGKYYVKYIRRPDPIILADLGDIRIDGENRETQCRLHESLHRIILEGAVRAAIASRAMPGGDDGKS